MPKAPPRTKAALRINDRRMIRRAELRSQDGYPPRESDNQAIVPAMLLDTGYIALPRFALVADGDRGAAQGHGKRSQQTGRRSIKGMRQADIAVGVAETEYFIIGLAVMWREAGTDKGEVEPDSRQGITAKQREAIIRADRGGQVGAKTGLRRIVSPEVIIRKSRTGFYHRSHRKAEGGKGKKLIMKAMGKRKFAIDRIVILGGRRKGGSAQGIVSSGGNAPTAPIRPALREVGNGKGRTGIFQRRQISIKGVHRTETEEPRVATYPQNGIARRHTVSQSGTGFSNRCGDERP